GQPMLRDLASTLARRAAAAELALGDPGAGLERARQAVERARNGDVQEWAAALRVSGECLAALGREAEARAAFAEARSLLQAGECVGEERRIAEAMERFGLGARPAEVGARSTRRGPAAEAAGGTAAAGSRRSPPGELALRNGRSFLSHDRALVASIRL